MKKDPQLIDLFLKGYGLLTNRKLELKERPDEKERKVIIYLVDLFRGMVQSRRLPFPSSE
jgi:hypothetical protein